MHRPLPALLLVLATAVLVLLGSYALRHGLIENEQWLARCVELPDSPACQLREWLGLLIHFRVLVWGALACAVPAVLLPGAWGWRLAVPGLLLGALGLALYSASLAVFAVVLALLRLVRAPLIQT